MHCRIAALAQRVLDRDPLDRDDAVFLSSLAGEDLYDLFYWANRIRLHFVGREVKFCAIVPAKAGGCSEDCAFCAQSRHHATTMKTPAVLPDETILDCARRALAAGATNFGIVNSGRGPSRAELEWLRPIFQKLAAEEKLSMCADLGALTPETASFLRECGVRRINHNLETSARNYGNIVTTHSYADRIKTLRIAKEVGLELCSGGIFGMGETWADRLDMIFDLRDLDVQVMPINFLNPIAGTPLADLPRLQPMECLHIIAVCRLLLPTADLKVAGGREVCLRDLQSWMFYAGANSAIIGNYLTTAGRTPELDLQMVQDLGLTCKPGCE